MCTIGDAYLAVNEPKTQHDDRARVPISHEKIPCEANMKQSPILTASPLSETIGALVLLHLAMAMLRIIVQAL